VTAPRVPGVAHQVAARLADLTTTGTARTGHTVPTDWEGLHASSAARSYGPVPGLQIDGFFPAATRLNTHHDWDHDAQFVLRLPEDWNGKLVVTGAPGVRRQYATDVVIGDRMLAHGYAYAATDKGGSGPEFFTTGTKPGESIAEWNARLTELLVAAKDAVTAYYGGAPQRTYVTGISNGGYLTRWQLEHNPDLVDGGVDWEGPLWRTDGPNILTHLPAALVHYPAWRDRAAAADHDAMLAAGYAPGSEFLWAEHHRTYWGLTQRIYRSAVDPGYQGAEEDYDYLARPAEVRDAVEPIALTGAIDRPLLSLHGTLDALLPIGPHADAYARLVTDAGNGALHRLYRIESGNHVDGYCDLFPNRLRPLQPWYEQTFQALERWVEQGVEPPPSRTIAGDPEPLS
jgi:dienelactone hydrolase